MKLVLILLILFVGFGAHAGELLLDTCIAIPNGSVGENFDGARIYLASNRTGALGLSCDMLEKANEELVAINVVLQPTILLLRTQQAAVLESLAQFGLAPEAVTIVAVEYGTALISGTMLLVLRKSVAECERMKFEELQQQVLELLKEKHNLGGKPTFQIRD